MGDKKYHYLYKTVIPTHGYYYYGIHSTDNLCDGYQGSGTYIKRFKKQGYHLITGIVEFYNSRKELLDAERQIVNERLVRDVRCLNLTTGGNYTPPKRGVTKATRKKISIIHSGKVLSDETKKKISKSVKTKLLDPDIRKKMARTGMKHTEEAKRKISKAASTHKHTTETKHKIGKAHKNKVVSAETKAKQSNAKKGKPAKSNGLYITPKGTFRTSKEAAIANGVSVQTIFNRCANANNVANGYYFVKGASAPYSASVS